MLTIAMVEIFPYRQSPDFSTLGCQFAEPIPQSLPVWISVQILRAFLLLITRIDAPFQCLSALPRLSTILTQNKSYFEPLRARLSAALMSILFHIFFLFSAFIVKTLNSLSAIPFLFQSLPSFSDYLLEGQLGYVSRYGIHKRNTKEDPCILFQIFAEKKQTTGQGPLHNQWCILSTLWSLFCHSACALWRGVHPPSQGPSVKETTKDTFVYQKLCNL